MDNTYSFETNSAGRRILILYDYVDVDACDDIKAEDFDIIFIDAPQITFNSLRHLLSKIAPLLSEKCGFKPCFMTAFIRNEMRSMSSLFDGFAQSALDKEVTVLSEEIYRRLNALGISLHFGTIRSEKDFFMGLSQLCLSRGKMNFIASSIITWRKGLSAYFGAYVDIHKAEGCGISPGDKNLRNRVEWMQDEGLIEPVAFVERIHRCPNCQSSRLLFSECCGKCKSSNIHQEDMIHHFRCANIAPESDYQYDDQLRCPKCKRFLRHIGIDYDRPAKVQTCNECGETQMYSTMKCTCAKCGHTTVPDNLVPYDVQEFTFTPKGRDFISSYHPE